MRHVRWNIKTLQKTNKVCVNHWPNGKMLQVKSTSAYCLKSRLNCLKNKRIRSFSGLIPFFFGITSYSDWIRRFTLRFNLQRFSLNVVKCGPEKTPYLNTYYIAATKIPKIPSVNNWSILESLYQWTLNVKNLRLTDRVTLWI